MNFKQVYSLVYLRTDAWLRKRIIKKKVIKLSPKEIYSSLTGNIQNRIGPDYNNVTPYFFCKIDELRKKFYYIRESNELIHRLIKLNPSLIDKYKTIADDICKNKIEILQSEPVSIGSEVNWTSNVNTEVEILYSLNRFHYFRDLLLAFMLTGDQKYSDKGIFLILDWIEKNEYANPISWESRSISERVINWLWFIAAIKGETAFTPQAAYTIIQSLYLQIKYLSRHIEYYTENLHLLFNAKAIYIFSVLFSEFKESAFWEKKSLDLFEKEIYRQCAAGQNSNDYFHIESSTGYHLWATKILTEMILFFEKIGAEYDRNLDRILENMMEVLLYISKPDGRITHFGDYKDIDVLISPGELLCQGACLFSRPDFRWIGRQLNERTAFNVGMRKWDKLESIDPIPPNKFNKSYSKSGYYIYRSDWTEESDQLIVDCGNISNLLSNPGHGHADALSFEITVGGKPVFVDSGTYTYKNCTKRSYFRGTTSHNTVSVNRLDQSELWSAFRVGKMANAHLLKWHIGEDCLFFSGYHDGYLRLNSKMLHRRDIVFVAKQFMILRDTFSFQGQRNNSKIEQIFHLSPNCQVDNKNNHLIIRHNHSDIVKIVSVSNTCAKTDVIHGGSHTQFGRISESYNKITPSTSLLYLLNQNCNSNTLIFLFKDEAAQYFADVKLMNGSNLLQGEEDCFNIKCEDDIYEVKWNGSDYSRDHILLIEAEGFEIRQYSV